ncbi:hypothetical protein [Streptomyces daliensis]|uniref:Uncharacterized protein n=1 Tax=Streptomyces daliensis TaxID=299421 RepID=A0A8T4J4E5_9ACTN|nr:hypothetical protein [Streptomyces daliensis]
MTPKDGHGPGPGPDPGPRQELLEERLRDALDARARMVGPDSLRRATPPSEQVGRRFPIRATALTLLALAAALAGVLLAVGWVERQGGEAPVEPAHPHERTTRPSSPAPSPSPPSSQAPSDAASPSPAPD